jgi:hypothetical protein
MKDICPIMSIGGVEKDCTDRCAWYDTSLRECAISRINGNLKVLEDAKELISAINNISNTLCESKLP